MNETPKDHSMDFPLRENGEPWLKDVYRDGEAKAAGKGRERREQLRQQGHQQAGSWLPADLVREERYEAPSNGIPKTVPLARATKPVSPDSLNQPPTIPLKMSAYQPDSGEPITVPLRMAGSPPYATMRPPKPSPFDVKLKADAAANAERGERVAAAVNEKVAAMLGSVLEEHAVKSGVDLKKEWGFDPKNDLVVRDGEPRMVAIRLKRYRSMEDHSELESTKKQMKDSALEQMVAIGLRPSEAELKIEEIAREASAAANIPYPTKWHEKGFENHVEERLGDRQSGGIIVQQRVSIEIPEKELAQRLGVGSRVTYAKGDALAAVNAELFGDDGIPRGSR